LPKTVLFVAH